jgi:predicted patatin/cPLA2 family phospholipase
MSVNKKIKILRVISNTYNAFYVLGTSLSNLNVIIYLTITKKYTVKVSISYTHKETFPMFHV